MQKILIDFSDGKASIVSRALSTQSNLMRNHDSAENLSPVHQLVDELPMFFRRKGFDKGTAEFLKGQIFFAYPGTLWFKISVDSDDLGMRHKLNSAQLSAALNGWFKKKASLHNIVFDLRFVTIFDIQGSLELFRSTGLPKTKRYYLCEGEIEKILRSFPEIEREAIFASESMLLRHLRDIPKQRFLDLPLPMDLDFRGLDAVLLRFASEKKLRNIDAINLDMTEVMSVSFRVHSMLSPIIHSLAHSHGILAKVTGARRKVINDISAHGSLRVMRSYLVQTPYDYIATPEAKESDYHMPMLLFEPEDLVALQELCVKRLKDFIHNFKIWFADVSSSEKSPEAHLKKIGDSLFAIVHELIENVTRHSFGVGYVMMELDPLPEKGFSIYIGDTGIGLQKGIANSYDLELQDDESAVRKALLMTDYLQARRRMPGSKAFGGRGLGYIGVMLKELSGTFSIRSGNAMAIFSPADDKNPIQSIANMFSIQGTHVHIRIPSKWKSLQNKPRPVP